MFKNPYQSFLQKTFYRQPSRPTATIRLKNHQIHHPLPFHEIPGENPGKRRKTGEWEKRELETQL